MERGTLNHPLLVNLTAEDRRVLERIAEERGATLSGVVRRLIRDAARNVGKQGIASDNAQAATR